jgi:hypothetical protein
MEVDNPMPSQAANIAKRLCEAESPFNFHDWEEQDGYYIATCRASIQDVPHLIDIARKWSDPDWPSSQDGLDVDLDNEGIDFLPVTAWRTLADLKSCAAVEPLIDMLCELDDECDDWASTELPHVFGKIGEPAMEAIVRLANDANRQDFIRAVAARSLRCVAEYHVETRDQIVACLTEMMVSANIDNIEFNTDLLVDLVELQAVEAAEPIERAFASDCLDIGMMGDWEVVRRELGVEGLGLDMPVDPHNSIEQSRGRMGIGIFSKQSIFAYDEIDHDAEQAYYQRAWDLFSKSNEAQQVVDRDGDLAWFQMLLEFGLNHLGEAVDQMTAGSVSEFVLDHIPRKVSTESERAASIIFELTMFWEYLDRVFELPEAQSIIECLKADGIVARLEAKLSDSANFGMAKSIVMSGKNAGYDMTSEAGMAEYMAAYNRSLQSDAEAESVPIAARGERVGRNDPCPCGSGKKFKKCCHQ